MVVAGLFPTDRLVARILHDLATPRAELVDQAANGTAIGARRDLDGARMHWQILERPCAGKARLEIDDGVKLPAVPLVVPATTGDPSITCDVAAARPAVPPRHLLDGIEIRIGSETY